MEITPPNGHLTPILSLKREYIFKRRWFTSCAMCNTQYGHAACAIWSCAIWSCAIWSCARVRVRVSSGCSTDTRVCPHGACVHKNIAALKIRLKAMSHEAIFLATCNAMALQVARKISSCDTPCLQLVSQRKIAFQVAEKVEAASTFRNATRQVVTACDTPHCNLSRNFFEKEPITIRHNQNAADIFKYSAGVKYHLIACRKTSCVRLTS